MLLRRVAADNGAGAGESAGRPRLFSMPRLLVGLAAAKCGAPECDLPAACSPTSPLDLRAFAVLGGSLFRSLQSSRSWDLHRVGLSGLIDTLIEPAADAKNRLLEPQMRPSFKLPQRLAKSCTSQPRDCVYAPPELVNVETAAGTGGKPVPCSRSYGDVKSGP